MWKRLRTWFLWLIGGFVALVVIAGVFGSRGGGQQTAGNPTSAQARTPVLTATPPKPATVAPAAPTLKPAVTAVPPLPSMGDKVSAGNWEIELLGLDGADRLGQTVAQGAFMVITVAAKNLHRETSQLNSFDFQVSSASGARYNSSSEGSSALLGSEGPEVLLFGAQIQPGLIKRLRVVFDVNPSEVGFVLKAAGIQFRL